MLVEIEKTLNRASNYYFIEIISYSIIEKRRDAR